MAKTCRKKIFPLYPLSDPDRRIDVTTRIVIAALAALMLPACALLEVEPDTASPFFAVPTGSVLEINQPLTIRAGSTRVWLQRGNVGVGRDWWHPACNLEINTLDRERDQIVAPGSFEVVRVQGVEEYTQLQAPMLAAASPVSLRAAFDDGGVTWMWLGHHLWLDSAEQPDVRRLTCFGVYSRPFEARPPSIDQIREALGSAATLHLPDQ